MCVCVFVCRKNHRPNGLNNFFKFNIHIMWVSLNVRLSWTLSTVKRPEKSVQDCYFHIFGQLTITKK